MRAFDWCVRGQHDKCIRSYQRFLLEKKKVVYLDEEVFCQCRKRGCKCYVKPADRVKEQKPKKKRKK